jgi:Flp pilus assembly protein TadB
MFPFDCLLFGQALRLGPVSLVPSDGLLVISSALFGLAVALGGSYLIVTLDELNGNYQADIIDRMNRLGLPTGYVPYLLRLRWPLALLVFLSVWLGLHMLPVGIILGLLSWRGVSLWLEFNLERNRTRVRDQLVTTGRNLATQVRAGLPLLQGLAAVATNLPAPLGVLLRQLVNHCNQGRPLKVALLDLKNRLRLDGMAIVALALIVAEERGGELPQVLDRITHSLEEAQRVERKRESDTAAGRLVVYILTIFPLVFLGIFFFLDPEGTSLIFSLVEGQIVLCLGGILTYISWRWSQAILARVE